MFQKIGRRRSFNYEKRKAIEFHGSNSIQICRLTHYAALFNEHSIEQQRHIQFFRLRWSISLKFNVNSDRWNFLITQCNSADVKEIIVVCPLRIFAKIFSKFQNFSFAKNYSKELRSHFVAHQIFDCHSHR